MCHVKSYIHVLVEGGIWKKYANKEIIILQTPRGWACYPTIRTFAEIATTAFRD